MNINSILPILIILLILSVVLIILTSLNCKNRYSGGNQIYSGGNKIYSGGNKIYGGNKKYYGGVVDFEKMKAFLTNNSRENEFTDEMIRDVIDENKSVKMPGQLIAKLEQKLHSGIVKAPIAAATGEITLESIKLKLAERGLDGIYKDEEINKAIRARKNDSVNLLISELALNQAPEQTETSQGTKLSKEQLMKFVEDIVEVAKKNNKTYELGYVLNTLIKNNYNVSEAINQLDIDIDYNSPANKASMLIVLEMRMGFKNGLDKLIELIDKFFYDIEANRKRLPTIGGALESILNEFMDFEESNTRGLINYAYDTIGDKATQYGYSIENIPSTVYDDIKKMIEDNPHSSTNDIDRHIIELLDGSSSSSSSSSSRYLSNPSSSSSSSSSSYSSNPSSSSYSSYSSAPISSSYSSAPISSSASSASISSRASSTPISSSASSSPISSSESSSPILEYLYNKITFFVRQKLRGRSINNINVEQIKATAKNLLISNNIPMDENSPIDIRKLNLLALQAINEHSAMFERA